MAPSWPGKPSVLADGDVVGEPPRQQVEQHGHSALDVEQADILGAGRAAVVRVLPITVDEERENPVIACAELHAALHDVVLGVGVPQAIELAVDIEQAVNAVGVRPNGTRIVGGEGTAIVVEVPLAVAGAVVGVADDIGRLLNTVLLEDVGPVQGFSFRPLWSSCPLWTPWPLWTRRSDRTLATDRGATKTKRATRGIVNLLNVDHKGVGPFVRARIKGCVKKEATYLCAEI